MHEMNGKKRNFIYLAGNISDDNRTYEWREKFIQLVEDEPTIVPVNPCANAFNRAMKNATEDGLEFTKMARKISQKILRAKDYQMVKMCNVVVMNLELVGDEKPLIGTMHELVWAHDIFYIPIIAITGKDPNIYSLHPWNDECISKAVDVEEAVKMVKTFFLEY